MPAVLPSSLEFASRRNGYLGGGDVLDACLLHALLGPAGRRPKRVIRNHSRAKSEEAVTSRSARLIERIRRMREL
jgi:hypothetical protein